MQPHPALSGTAPRPAWQPIGLWNLLRLVEMYMPLLGIQSWRQDHTAATAQHLTGRDSPFWLPKFIKQEQRDFLEEGVPHPVSDAIKE